MSQNWNEGYFTDTGYTYGYYRELSPVFHRFILLLRGFGISPTHEPAHCELGFGQGISINIHSASNVGRFVGTDFNPSHATYARSLSNSSSLSADLFDDSFEQMSRRNDLPQFDSISLHGIWTWISRENQKIITDFARTNLKPGGVLYVSYNCFPGWSSAAPIRQLLSSFDRFADSTKDPTKRVDAALKFAQSLFAAEPAYLKSVVGIGDKLKSMSEQNRNYLAHEYLNRDWNCMYFTEVADILSDAKLEFASSASAFDLIDGINLNAAASDFLKSIPHAIHREQMRDYFVNTQFRKDYFVRGALVLHPAEKRNRLLEMRFALHSLPEAVNLKIKGPAGEVQLQETIYKPLLQKLASNSYYPKVFRELLNTPDDSAFSQTLQALVILVGLGVVSPCHPEQITKSVRKSCDAFNAQVLELSKTSSNVTTLASPVTGSGIPIDRISQLFLLSVICKSPDPLAFVWQSLRSTNEVLMKDSAALQGEEANIKELKVRYGRFEQLLPVYRALQVV